MEYYKIGDFRNTAEEKVVNFLSDNIKSSAYTLFTNLFVYQGNRNYEIDGMIITPHGIFVIETKNWKGRWKESGTEWITVNGAESRKEPFSLLNTKTRVLRAKLTELNSIYGKYSYQGILIIPSPSSVFEIPYEKKRFLFHLDNNLIHAITSRDYLRNSNSFIIERPVIDSIKKFFLGNLKSKMNVSINNWVLDEVILESNNKQIVEYLAHHKEQKEKKAIAKLYTLPDDPDLKREISLRLVKEKKVLSKLEDDPNIHQILDFGTLENDFSVKYVITKHIKYPSLRNSMSFLKTKEDIRLLLLSILKVVKRLHENNIIHRNLSPDCIYVNNETKEVILSEFNSARIEELYQRNQTFITSTTISDYIEYSAPEVISKNGVYGTYTDIYSIGKIIEYIVTLLEDENLAVFRKIIDRSTTEDYKKRYQNVSTMIKDIEELFE